SLDAGPTLEAILSAVAAGAGSAGAAAGVVLLLRRVAGGFGSADGGLAWMVAAFGIAVVAAAPPRCRIRGGSLGSWAARFGLAAAVAAVAVPPRLDDWGTITALVVAVGVVVLRPPAPRGTRPGRPGRRRRQADEAVRTPASIARADVPGRLVQRLERYETPAGLDCLRGRVCLTVAAGSRGSSAHVGFCPAFAATPTVELSTDYDGVEAVVTAAEVLPWGVRVECRLSEPADEPLEIPVDVSVHAAQ
ncbi:MAG: hypothetical protein ACKON8_10960, partial [Planctomycetota bacterium]